MRKFLITLIVCSLHVANIYALQSETAFLVQPYLQNADPNSIIIKWETTKSEESMVEYGLSPKLDKKENGISVMPSFTEVKLDGLKRFTTYYYRVLTGKLVSDIFQFKTHPFASDNESFQLLAMSDMQYDSQEPNKFSEIVNDGILPYLKTTYGENLPQNLDLVMVPGDLVENGTKYFQWKDHFFEPTHKLFVEVPVYPVLGNHEKNSTFYFKYFSLPENGTPAYAEH